LQQAVPPGSGDSCGPQSPQIKQRATLRQFIYDECLKGTPTDKSEILGKKPKWQKLVSDQGVRQAADDAQAKTISFRLQVTGRRLNFPANLTTRLNV
jgi:hypothetical protein